jgi:primosomal replication protein N
MENKPINHAVLSAVVVQKSVLRYTPAGVAVMTLDLDHRSHVLQAGSMREIAFNLQATALEQAAFAVDALETGQCYTFEGFWALAHYRSQRVAFHILHVV